MYGFKKIRENLSKAGKTEEIEGNLEKLSRIRGNQKKHLPNAPAQTTKFLLLIVLNLNISIYIKTNILRSVNKANFPERTV